MLAQPKAMSARARFREAFRRVFHQRGAATIRVPADASLYGEPRLRTALCRHSGHELTLLRAVEMERRLQKKRSGWNPL